MELDSLFQHVLDTNYVPTATEILQIQAFTTLAQCEINKLDDEINHHLKLANIQPIIQKRIQYQAIMDSHLALLSPMRRIIPEVLQSIFQWCLPGNRNPLMHHTEPPLLLGRVCRGWRTLTYATIELWSALHIIIPSDDNITVLATAVRDWFKRAGTSPLNISVLAHSPVGGILPVLNSVMEYSDQWQTLVLEVPKIGLLDVFSLVRGNFPMLQSLKLRLMARPPFQSITTAWLEYGDRGLNLLLRLFQCNSSLQHLELQIDSTIGWLSDLPQPYNVQHTSLTSLSLEFQYAFITGYNASERLVNLLGSFPNLKHCSISSSQYVAPIVPPDFTTHTSREVPVRLEKLQSLAVRAWNRHLDLPQRTSHISQVFERLETPSLTRVDFGLQKDREWLFTEIWQSLMDLLDRSSSSLSTLCIRRDNGVLKEKLRECLLSCPGLKELVIERTDLTFDSIPNDEEKVGNMILGVLSQDTICPNLASLSLFQFSSYQLDENAILDFLRCRTRMASPFTEFNVLPAIRCLPCHSSWNHHFEPVPGGEIREKHPDFLNQVDELRHSSQLRTVNLGDVESWARSVSWFGFEDN